MNIEVRVIIKIAYLYYLEIEKDEIEHIARKTNKEESEIMNSLLNLRHELSQKELKNIAQEDKITSLYMNILSLRDKKEKLEVNLRQRDIINSRDSLEIEKIEHNIKKKYKQRERLIQKKKNGHFIVRTPYKKIGKLLDIPEGNISVQMMRAIKQIKKNDPKK